MIVNIVKCPDCNKEIEVETKYKKAICNYCGYYFNVNDAIKKTTLANVEEKFELNSLDEKTVLDKLNKLIDEEKYEEVLKQIDKLDLNSVNFKVIYLRAKLCLFNKNDLTKLNTSDDSTDVEFWDQARDIIKYYNDEKNISKLLSSTDSNSIKNISESYKQMLIDKELCERIANKINEYFEKLDETPKRKKKIAVINSTEFFKRVLGINMTKFYNVNRDMTINYKHAGDDKHVYSRLSGFKNLNEVYDSLVENYDNYIKSITDYTKYNLFIGIVIVILIIIIAMVIF